MVREVEFSGKRTMGTRAEQLGRASFCAFAKHRRQGMRPCIELIKSESVRVPTTRLLLSQGPLIFRDYFCLAVFQHLSPLSLVRQRFSSLFPQSRTINGTTYICRWASSVRTTREKNQSRTTCHFYCGGTGLFLDTHYGRMRREREG